MKTALLLDEEEKELNRFRTIFNSIGGWQLVSYLYTAEAIESAKLRPYDFYLIDVDLVSWRTQDPKYENDSGADVALNIRDMESYEGAPLAIFSNFIQERWYARGGFYHISKKNVTTAAEMQAILDEILDHHQKKTQNPPA